MLVHKCHQYFSSTGIADGGSGIFNAENYVKGEFNLKYLVGVQDVITGKEMSSLLHGRKKIRESFLFIKVLLSLNVLRGISACY